MAVAPALPSNVAPGGVAIGINDTVITVPIAKATLGEQPLFLAAFTFTLTRSDFPGLS